MGLEEKGITGIKGIIFDLYNTLIDIRTDEDSLDTYEYVSNWLIYQGVKISAEDLKDEYRRLIKWEMETKWEKYPEIQVENIFARICKSFALWDIDDASLGIETARAFRAGSLRRLKVFPQSMKLLQGLEGYPMVIVSNGQRVFSEKELRYFGLYEHFDQVIFSSDIGIKKPDPRIFIKASKFMGLEPKEVMCMGDNFENDLEPSSQLGMTAMHIEEAWKKLADLNH